MSARHRALLFHEQGMGLAPDSATGHIQLLFVSAYRYWPPTHPNAVITVICLPADPHLIATQTHRPFDLNAFA